MDKLVYREEAYQIIGICMEMHRILGKGHSEVVYKDALEYDPIAIGYKKIILSYFYNADFVVFDKIILEVKAIELLTDSHVKQ
ncbi:MAG: GxxExxY protein [Bacteroidota bacterium]